METSFREMLEDFAQGRSSVIALVTELARKSVLVEIIRTAIGMAGDDEAVARELVGVLVDLASDYDRLEPGDTDRLTAFRHRMNNAFQEVLRRTTKDQMRRYFGVED